MASNLDTNRSAKPSLVRRGVASLVLAVVALAIFYVIAHVLFWVVLVVAVVGAVLWAANQVL